MKASYKVREDLVIEVDADTQRELFKELAGAAEVFGEAQRAACATARALCLHVAWCRLASSPSGIAWRVARG